jgi:hypothetical protein
MATVLHHDEAEKEHVAVYPDPNNTTRSEVFVLAIRRGHHVEHRKLRATTEAAAVEEALGDSFVKRVLAVFA